MIKEEGEMNEIEIILWLLLGISAGYAWAKLDSIGKTDRKVR
jgi:hypothetical protein